MQQGLSQWFGQVNTVQSDPHEQPLNQNTKLLFIQCCTNTAKYFV